MKNQSLDGRVVTIASGARVIGYAAGLRQKPKSCAYVTKLMGTVITLQRVIPRRASESLNRALGGEQMFLDGVDTVERRVYEERARKS